MKMRHLYLVLTLTILLPSCLSIVNKKFNYQETITPANIKSDIRYLKERLLLDHYDINWENKQTNILSKLDEVANISSTVTIDSFENRVAGIVNYIDDGHSRVIHQTNIEDMPSNFGMNRISDSHHYIRIANFMNTTSMNNALSSLNNSYNSNPTRSIIIDLRGNPGGTVRNVNQFLSYFLPSKSDVFHHLDCNGGAGDLFDRFVARSSEILSSLKYMRRTTSKAINGNPQLYLLIDEEIASGSMLSSYHLQRHGAYIIGSPPKGLFNTFGNTKGYKLPKSKLVVGLASCKIFISEELQPRMEDMLIPDYVPSKVLDLPEVIELIDSKNLEFN